MPAVAAYNGDSADADSDVNKCCAASLAESWEELIGDSLPPVSCICMHPTQKISATGHGSPAGSAKGGGCHVSCLRRPPFLFSPLMWPFQAGKPSICIDCAQPVFARTGTAAQVIIWCMATAGPKALLKVLLLLFTSAFLSFHQQLQQLRMFGAPGLDPAANSRAMR